MTNTHALRLEIATPSRSYPVVVGAGALQDLGSALKEAGIGASHFVVSSPTVWGLWGEAFHAALPEAAPIIVPDGERHKTTAGAGRIYDGLLKGGADRSATLLTLGGGVTCDMGGFAAATYMRGIRLAHVPTTLLAQVDAAIGGKVGVNLPGGKNLVGAFYQPSLVVIDPHVLATLPRREFRAGLYEVVKYGVACDRALVRAGVPGSRAADQARCRRADAGHRRLLPPQGRHRRLRRAGDGRQARAEFRPHRRACARGRRPSTGGCCTARPSRTACWRRVRSR